jgi:hypothetical protein
MEKFSPFLCFLLLLAAYFICFQSCGRDELKPEVGSCAKGRKLLNLYWKGYVGEIH